MTSANIFCQLLISIAVKHGVQTAVCSPGSRNTPLILAAEGCENLQTRVVVDERTAAFIALGEALVSQKPVMLICTSGTAMLNYAPAVAEAFYAGVPLIVVSADRPIEWIDQDDSQTIRQFEALEHFVKGSYNIPVFQPDLGKRGDDLKWFTERSVNDAMIKALAPKKGPVHINIELDVPLGKTIKGCGIEGRMINSISGPGDLSNAQMHLLATETIGKKVLILCGFMQPDNELRKSLNGLVSKHHNFAVMAETVSNVGAGGQLRYYMIDSLLSYSDKSCHDIIKPDIVISFGGSLISRQVKEWLRTFRPEMHWHIGYTSNTIDCLKSLTCRIETNPARFLRQLTLAIQSIERKNKQTATKLNSDIEFANGYKNDVLSLRMQAEDNLTDFVNDAPWSDIKAFSIIKKFFPSDANLFLSNGTAIRYDQLFGIRAHASFCNRGVSGIDGCTSTAVGGALAYTASIPECSPEKRQTVLITGDMSFSYDLGALGCGLAPDSLKIIVLNNGGGGIFRFIGSTSALPGEILERSFCANPMLNIKSIASAFSFDYLCCKSETELRKNLPVLFSNPTATILEIKTDGAVSASLLKSLLS